MDPDEVLARLQNGDFGQAGGGSSTAPTAMVYLGQFAGPDRGPAMHADDLGGASPGYTPATKKGVSQGRGPLSHFDPNDAPWDEQRTKQTGDRATDADSAAAAIYGWTDERLKKWEKLLLANGLIKPGEYNYEDLVSAWQSAVKGASNLYTAGKKVTPEQYIDVYVGSNGVGGKKDAADRDRTSTSYQAVDDLDARAAAEDAYKAFLGTGNVTGRQAGAVKAALQAYADAHPSITTEHTQKDGDTVTRSSGGMSADAAGQIVEDTVKAKPNYAEYQAATTVHNWLTQALGPAVSGY